MDIILKKFNSAIFIETKEKQEIYGCDLIGPINKKYIVQLLTITQICPRKNSKKQKKRNNISLYENNFLTI